MTSPGPCVRLTWRRWLLLLLIGGVVVGAALWLSSTRNAGAQGQLTLADFDATGLDTDLLALIQTGSVADGNFTELYATPSTGSLLEGELGLSSGNSLVNKVRWGDHVDQILISNGSDLNLQTYFTGQGAGTDLTLRLQTSDSSGTGTISSATANTVRFNMNSSAQALLNGLSSSDRLIIALTRAGQPPAKVANVSAEAASDTSIDVSWDTAARADGYRVEWGTTSGIYTGSATTTETSHTITSLTANTTYYVRVTATRTAIDDGTPSDEASASTLLPPPAQVTGVNVTANGHDRIAVSWTAVSDATGYVVEWDDDSGFAGPSSAASASSPYAITGLDEGTTYHVRVRATRTGAADGPASASVSATTALQPPAQVTGVSAQAASDTEINVSWNLAVRAGGYRVEWGTASGVYTDSTTTAALNHKVSSLSADTPYFFRVTATRAGADDGPPSAEANARTNPAPPPSPPAGVVAVALSDREIRVEWQPSQNATGYIVQWDTDAAFPAPEMAEVVGNGVIIEDLRSETEYFVRVIGTREGALDSAPSAADSAITEQAPVKTWSDRFPGGAVAAQLALSLFAGLMAGVRVRSDKTPQREVKIVVVMCAASLVLPAFGTGNIFWTGGIVLLVMLATGAVYFLSRR